MSPSTTSTDVVCNEVPGASFPGDRLRLYRCVVNPRSFVGIIEGFYGTPWTWDDRIATCRFAQRFGADSYMYAPKSDPMHRDRWREPYERADLDGFARLLADANVRVGYAISPGLSIRIDDPDDRSALVAKCRALRDVGIEWFCLALDDIHAGPDMGRQHGELCAYLLDALGVASLLLVPTDYTSIRSNPYLDGLAASVPEGVDIGWTGPTVVADHITAEQASGRAAALGGRRPWLWDNYPVNDGIMTERLFMGPRRGLDPELANDLTGYLANPMVQARASWVALASAMTWWQSGTADEGWQRAISELGWDVFARCCDETHLASLTGDARRAFLVAASECGAPGIDDDAQRWIRQVHREAKVALAYLDAETIEAQLFAVAQWTRLPDPAVSVFGPRRSFRPVLGQRDDVGFELKPEAIDYDRNAIDALVLGQARQSI